MNTQTPELIALCRLDEDGEDQLAGWAMVLPETEKVVAYVPPRTGVGIGMVNMFPSLESAGLIFSCGGLYPVTDLSTLPGAPR